MSWRRLVPLALVVTALLAVVAVAAGGHPLGRSAGRGAGLPTTFWDYAFTTFVIVEVLLALAAFVALFFLRREPTHRTSSQRRTAAALIILILGAALLSYVARHVDLHRLFHPGGTTGTTGTATGPIGGGKSNRQRPQPPGHVQFQWDELAIILAVLLVLGVLAAKTRSRLGPGTARHAPEVLAAALDESLDDLRNDPDLRRAIIAAYARMERALAAAGLPRHHAEAPLEYLERVLLELDASAPAVRRLTDLFEWARFSHHEPETAMRDEAIDALIAVRDELRASELTPA